MDRRWLLGGLLVAGGIGLARALTARPKITRHTRLLLIGDSLAAGLNPQIKQLATDERVPYVGSGVSGSRIDQWARSVKLNDILVEFQPTLTLVSLGTNDAYMMGDVWARQEPFLKQLLGKLREFPNVNSNSTGGPVYGLGTEVVWVLPPTLPPASSGMRLNTDFIEHLAEAVPNPFDSTELDIPRAPDNLHPTIAGYAGWAGALWSWLH